MALSGTITGTCDNTSYTLTCEWSATQDTAKNTSKITAKVYLKAPSGWSTQSSSWSCTINGTQVTSGSSLTVGSSKVLLGSRSWTVTHASDGTCSTTISFSYSNGVSSIGSYLTKTGSGSKKVTLDTISTTASFTLSSSSLDMGSSQKVTISNHSSSHTYTIAYTFGQQSTTVATKTSNSSTSFTPPVSLATQIPNATSGTCTVKVTTYSGSTSLGTTSKTFTLKVPSSVVPSVSIKTTYNNASGSTLIAGKSTVTVTPSGSGAQGSTIKSYTYSGAGLSGTGSSKTTGTLAAGDYLVTVTATDSRGRTKSAQVGFSMTGYSAPTLKVSAFRADGVGNANNNGTFARVKLTYSISNTSGNAKQYKLEYKTTTGTTYTLDTDWTTLGSYSATDAVIAYWKADFSTTTSYNLRVSVRDSTSSVSAVTTISTMATVFNIEKAGVGIGKLHENGAADIGGTTFVSGEVKFSKSPNFYGRIGYYETDSCTFVSNGSNNWLRLNNDGTLTWKGSKVAVGGQEVDGSIIVRRAGNQFVLYPAQEGNACYVTYRDTAGTRTGFVGTPNANYNMHVLSENGLVVLRGSYISCRNADDSAYVEIRASNFAVNSEAKWKENIEPLEKSAMDMINSTTVYEYNRISSPDYKEIGLVIDNGVPEEIVREVIGGQDAEVDKNTPTTYGLRRNVEIDKGVDLYSMCSIAWKALQEKDEQIKDLEQRVQELENLILKGE